MDSEVAGTNMADKSTVGRTSTLKKQLGLVSATSYMIGNIIGTGIFISPSVILEGMGSSVGLSLLVWTMCGALTYCAAMCYAEYGTRLKKSGGTYTYIREAFGDFVGFLFLWTDFLIGRPLSTALACLAAAQYIMRPLFLSCPDMAPTASKVMVGYVILGFFVMANMYSVKLGARLQTVTTVCKVTALLTIIVAGMVHIGQGHTDNFSEPFKTTHLTPEGVVLAFYAGLFAFTGWSIVNTAVEEICNPYRNIPLAIFGGLAVPTLGYLLANVAYHAVLTNGEILSGIAVAYVFGERKLGFLKWVVLSCVAVSAGGIANVNIFIFSRTYFVGGRDRLFPRFLSMINVHRRTPQPAILVMFILATIYMCLGDIKTVLGAYSFFKSGGECLAVAGIFIIRRRHPAKDNTYQVNWLFPVIYVVFFLVLSVTAITFDPRLYLPTFCVSLLGVPLYFLSRSRWWQMGYLARVNKWITLLCHRILLCEPASPDVV
ncbi:Y+L amino acid transporter 2-like [Haliotis rubra]|uniref:Y+L amino acid transporter 2-like n=1 Tax=Haliotis rubra TaxID=36100 RepID=UPI001EE54600|nr:Y+L amino acid transporter 2-like [Haliotis rubra]